MSSAAEGWYVDPSTGTNLRYWDGSTWTDEVAPLPPDVPRPGLFRTEPETAETVTEQSPPEDTALEVTDTTSVEHPPLDTDLEQTRLTRRELRARRGADHHLNDAPRHLPPLVPPPVVIAPADELPVELELELEIAPVQAAVSPTSELSPEEAEDPSRRWRIVRLSVLLGVLAVVSSVGVLTAGTL